MQRELAEVLKQSFPPLVSAFAYGSAVFSQAGRSAGTMLDLLMVIQNPIIWHTLNQQLNPHHYSTVSRFSGPRLTSFVQNLPGGLYFNTDLELAGLRVKYGVISLERALKDLNQWSDLIFAGRLHKPVLPIPLSFESDPISKINEQVNRPAALALAILRNSPQHTVKWSDILMRIVGISYSGDIRMVLQAEDRRKIERIVDGQYEQLLEIYKKAACDLGIEYDSESLYGDFNSLQLEKMIPNTQTQITLLVSSTTQTAKGIFTAPPKKAFRYLVEKIKKRLQST